MADSLKMDVELGKNLILGSIFHEGNKIQQLIGLVQQAGPQGPQALGQALFTDFQHAKQAIIKNQLPLDPRAWSAEGGVIDQVVKDVCELIASKLGQQYVSPQFMVGVKGFLMKALHDDETNSGGPGSKHVLAAQDAMQQGPAPDGGDAGPPPDDGSGGPPMPPDGSDPSAPPGGAPQGPGLMAPTQEGM